MPASLQQSIGCLGVSPVHVRGTSATEHFDLRITPAGGLGLRASVPLVLLAREFVRPAAEPGPGARLQRQGYDYEVLMARTRESLFSYHLHAMGASPVVWPHLHPGRGWADDLPRSTRTHLPTGLVPLGEIVRVLILDFGVRPARPDWERILVRAGSMIAELA